MDPLDTQVYPADDVDALLLAARLLRAGEVVAFPTDTVYGVGAHAFIEGAVAAIYTVKGRPLEKAIPLLLSSSDDLAQVSGPLPEAAWRLAAQFWPGALTLIVPKAAHIPDIVSAGPGLAVRVPDHPVVPELIRQLGAPLATTSANLSGAASPTTADEVYAQLKGRIALILDGGPCPGGIPSTVLDLTTTPPKVLRQGGIPIEALERVIGRIER